MSARLARTAGGWWLVTEAGLIRLGLTAPATAALLAGRAALAAAIQAGRTAAAAALVGHYRIAAMSAVPTVYATLAHPGHCRAQVPGTSSPPRPDRSRLPVPGHALGRFPCSSPFRCCWPRPASSPRPASCWATRRCASPPRASASPGPATSSSA